MISNALTSLTLELNNFLRLKFGLNDDIVVLSNLVEASGEPLYKAENKLILSLINIQEEKKIQKAGFQNRNAPIYLNLFILVTSSFDNKLKEESLKFLSATISFFQGKRVFRNNNTPFLSSNIDKLSVDIFNLDLNELSNVFSTLGAKYSPCIAYKVSMLVIEEEKMGYVAPQLTGRDTDSDIKK